MVYIHLKIYPTDPLCTLLGAGFNLLFIQKSDHPLGGNDTIRLTDMLVLVRLRPPSMFLISVQFLP